MADAGHGPGRAPPPPRVPPEILSELPATESVRRVASVRVLRGPGESAGLGGVAVLTDQRLAIVPGAEGSPPDTVGGDGMTGLLGELVSALWRPRPRPRTSSGGLAARARPGVELPLSFPRKAFVARVPRCLGLELTLPLPDPRPPWALYLELSTSAEASAWAEAIETLRAASEPRPDLERPYALYYLLRALPRPIVLLEAPDGRRRRGALRLAEDGLEIGGTERDALFPYESVDRVEFALPTKWRRARMVVTVAEREWVLVPARKVDTAPLLDAGHLLAEVAGRPVDRAVGTVRGGRVAVTLTAAGGVAAGLLELLRWLL